MHQSYARLGRVLAVACAAVSVTACATVTRGTTEPFTVASEPPGAKAKTTIGFKCDATPCTFKVEHKADFDVTVSKKGYKTETQHVTHHFTQGGTAGLVGNVVVGGGIGIVIDALSGATQGLTPNPLLVKLEPEGGWPAEATPVAAAAPVASAEPAPAPAAETAPAPAAAAAAAPASAAASN